VHLSPLKLSPFKQCKISDYFERWVKVKTLCVNLGSLRYEEPWIQARMETQQGVIFQRTFENSSATGLLLNNLKESSTKRDKSETKPWPPEIIKI